MSLHNPYCLGPYECAKNLNTMSHESGHHRVVSRAVNKYYEGFNEIFMAFEDVNFRYKVLSIWRDNCKKEADKIKLTEKETSHLKNLITAHYRHIYRTEKALIRKYALERRQERRNERKLRKASENSNNG